MLRWLTGLVLVEILSGCSCVSMVYPPMKVYIQESQGKADLAEAEYNRQTAVREAEARLESAKFDAQAEIERARGVAEANKIIGDSLKGNDSYLRYLWIQHLDEGNQVIYVPTEANLPIMEAGKRSTINGNN